MTSTCLHKIIEDARSGKKLPRNCRRIAIRFLIDCIHECESDQDMKMRAAVRYGFLRELTMVVVRPWWSLLQIYWDFYKRQAILTPTVARSIMIWGRADDEFIARHYPLEWKRAEMVTEKWRLLREYAQISSQRQSSGPST